MSIKKQELRLTAEKAKDNFMPNFMVPTRDVVLALLDELDNREKLRAAANRVVNQQDIEMQELRQRVAELEAREVTLPEVEKWRSVDAVRSQNSYKVLVSKALADAGIRINGEG